MLNFLKTGQKYLNSWPLRAELNMIFPENRVIKATQFAQKFMPFIAVFAVVWQQIYAKYDSIAFALAILTAIFALLLPLQGLYWLAKRANRPLDSQTLMWFQQINERLMQQGQILPIVKDPVTYQDLALVLQRADKVFDGEFWREI